jgi:hypothetical protein
MKYNGILFFLLCSLGLLSQEKFGIVNSNYHPVSSIHWNASSSADSRTYMQLNLVGVNAGVMTNAAYLPQFSFWSFMKSGWKIGTPQTTTSKQKKWIYGNLVADGPTFTFSKKNFGIGVFARGRSVVDARRIPYQVTNMLLNGSSNGLSESDKLHVKNAKLSNMTWLEYGLNFAYMVKKRRNDIISLGGNVKYLTGIDLVYVNLDKLDATYSPNNIEVQQLSGKLRTVPPAFGSGKGWGLDVGATYRKMLSHIDNYNAHSRSSKCGFVDYKYKVGLSLRDLGYIKFGGGTKASLDGSGSFNTVAGDSTYQQRLEANFNTVQQEGVPVTAMTPAALSGQFDYNFENDFYFNVSVNKSILPNRVIAAQSSDLISFAPRFETRLVEVAVPVTFQRFMYPQLGFAFRFRSFVVGFDNVLPFAIRKNTSGLNVYFNLAIALFKNPACGGINKKVDDCTHYKSRRGKIKRKNTLISPNPRKNDWH